MVAPINYAIDVASPFEQAVGGLKLGATVADIQAKQVEAQRIEQARMAAAQEQQRFFSLENPTRQDVIRYLSVIPPEQGKLVADQIDALGKEGQQAMLQVGGQAISAITAGKPEIAAQLMRDRAGAERNPKNAQAYETLAKLVEANPGDALKIVTPFFGLLPGSKDLIENLGRVQEQQFAAEKQPDVLRRAAAEATQAERQVQELDIKLRTLEQVKAAELLKAQSDAQRAQVEAKFAERLQNLEIERGKAQAARDRAAAAKTEAETLELKDRASKGEQPTYNAQAGGYIVPVSKANPNGGFIPLNQPANAKSQQAAVQALKTAGYDPVTGKDDISELIKKSTGSTAGLLTDEAYRFVGESTAGMKAIAALEPIAKQMALDMLGGKLGAGISNPDREFIVSAFGDIANPRKTREEKLLAWNSAKNRMLTSGMLPPPTQQATPTPAPGQPVAPALSNLTDSELLRQLNIPAPGRR
jgi:hypothetical protein